MSSAWDRNDAGEHTCESRATQFCVRPAIHLYINYSAVGQHWSDRLRGSSRVVCELQLALPPPPCDFVITLLVTYVAGRTLEREP